MIEVKTTDELKALVKANRIVVVDFHASWCNPCKSLAPKFEKVANDWDGTKVVFAKFDIDNGLDVVKSEYGLRAVPTVLVFTECGEKFSMIKDPSDVSINSYLNKITSP
jgi:thioredoxin 1